MSTPFSSIITIYMPTSRCKKIHQEIGDGARPVFFHFLMSASRTHTEFSVSTMRQRLAQDCGSFFPMFTRRASVTQLRGINPVENIEQLSPRNFRMHSQCLQSKCGIRVHFAKSVSPLCRRAHGYSELFASDSTDSQTHTLGRQQRAQ